MAAITLAMERTVVYFFTSLLHPEIRIPGTVPRVAAASHLSTRMVKPGIGSEIHRITRMETREAVSDSIMS